MSYLLIVGNQKIMSLSMQQFWIIRSFKWNLFFIKLQLLIKIKNYSPSSFHSLEQWFSTGVPREISHIYRSVAITIAFGKIAEVVVVVKYVSVPRKLVIYNSAVHQKRLSTTGLEVQEHLFILFIYYMLFLQ